MSNNDIVIFLGSALIAFEIRNLYLIWKDRKKAKQ